MDSIQVTTKNRIEAEVVSMMQKGYKGWVIVNFLFGTGCRSETLLNVKVEDVDFSDEVILFRHMKTRRQITVPLSPTLKTVLKEYIQVMNLSNEHLLFSKLNGEKMCYDTLHQNITPNMLHLNNIIRDRKMCGRTKIWIMREVTY